MLPMALWTYTPELADTEELDSQAPDWERHIRLTKSPPDMEIVGGKTLSWRPAPADFEPLKRGVRYEVALEVTGSHQDQNGVEQELFTRSKAFSLTSQFACELGQEAGLELHAGDSVVLASGDFNSDGRSDLVAGTGLQTDGALNMYLQRPGNLLPAPTVLTRTGHYSAVWAGDMDGDHCDDILAANWTEGRLNLFYQDPRGPFKREDLPAGPGPIALSVARFGGQGQPLQVATLLGAGRSLVIQPLQPDHTAGEAVRVPVPSSGSQGWVFPWRSAELGPGFVTITPLARTPFQFAPWNNGTWNKGGPKPVASPLEELRLIVGAAVLDNSHNGPQQLTVFLADWTEGATTAGGKSEVLVFSEQGGQFTLSGHIPLAEPALGLLALDFNRDGWDDLFIVMRDQSGIYFSVGNGQCMPGPQLTRTPPMRGPLVALKSQRDQPIQLLLLKEDYRAQLVNVQFPAVPVPPPAAAPASQTKGGTK